MRTFRLPRHRYATGFARGVPKVDMGLDGASDCWVQDLPVDYDINSAADYNFWPAQKEGWKCLLIESNNFKKL